MSDIQERIKELLKSADYLFDREEACKMALLALVADESLFLYGPPGTAKSMTAKWAASLLETDKYFSCLLNQYTQPDELFGPVNVQSLGNGIREIMTEGYMPEAEIAFLDEIWKAGPAILNTLLTICNEKTFRNGNRTMNVPLKLLISASNEFPSEDSGLEPLYDRFLIRLPLGPVERKDSFVKLITGDKSQKSNSDFKAISKEELEEWKTGSSSVEVPKEISDFIYSLRLRLNERGIYVSDRRWKKSVGLMRTSAFLNGRKKIGYSDLFLLENVLWSRLEERNAVRECSAESVTKETIKGSFTFTERILSEIGKLAAFEVTDTEKYDELAKMIDSEISYLGSLKKELEVARNGGENFWKNMFSGLCTEFELEMMDKGIEMLKEFITDAESGLEGLRFSKRPEVKQTISELGKNGVPPTVVLEKESKTESENQEELSDEGFTDNVDSDIVDIEKITKIETVDAQSETLPEESELVSNNEISSENEVKAEQEEQEILSKNQNEVKATENQIQEQVQNEEVSEVVSEQEKHEEYEMKLSRTKNFDELVSMTKYPYAGDSSDRRYIWNENENNGSKWWGVGSRFYQMLDGDRNMLSSIEAECLKKGVKIGGKYHWVFAVCYIFEKNDGIYDWKTKAELKWLLGSAWKFLEPVFEEALS